jgi:hypothetical protein
MTVTAQDTVWVKFRRFFEIFQFRKRERRQLEQRQMVADELDKLDDTIISARKTCAHRKTDTDLKRRIDDK